MCLPHSNPSLYTCKLLRRRRRKCIGTHRLCCFNETWDTLFHFLGHNLNPNLNTKRIFRIILTICHCVFFAATLSKINSNAMGSNVWDLCLWTENKDKIQREQVTTITWGKQAQNSFSRNGYARALWSRVTFQSIKVYVWCVAFSFFWYSNGGFPVQSLSSETLPYRDATKRRGAGKGKRKEELTTLTSQVSTCWQLNHYSGVCTVTARDSNDAKSLFFYWNVCIYTVVYQWSMCVVPGSVCTCLKHQWCKRREQERMKKARKRRWEETGLNCEIVWWHF